MKKITVLGILLILFAMGCNDGSGSDDTNTTNNNEDTETTNNNDTAEDSDTSAVDTNDAGSEEDTDAETDSPFTPEPFVPKDNEVCSMDELYGSTAVGSFCPAEEVYCNGSCFAEAGESKAGCQLITINTVNMEGLAIDATHLYFTSYNSVFRTNLTTSATECVIGGLSFPDGILLYNDQVYVGLDEKPGISGVVRVGKDGSAPVLLTNASQGGTSFSVVDDTLYFTGMSSWDGNVYGVPLAGGAAKEIFTDRFDNDGYAVMDGYIYVMADDLVRASVDAPDSWEEMVSSLYGEVLFEVDGTLYWLADLTGELNWPELYMFHIGDSEPTEVQELEEAKYMAHNDMYLFFVNRYEDDNGTTHIYSVPLAGGTVETVATFESSTITSAMATNAELIVRTGYNNSTGGIFRIPLN